jgi:prevent-host-death family protein
MTIFRCYPEIVKRQTVSVTEFKSKCLSLLDGVGKNGGTIIVTKRGRPLAKVVPAPAEPRKSLKNLWAGEFSVPDEILMADTSDHWEVVRESRRKRGKN